jgi:hypothetical protein
MKGKKKTQKMLRILLVTLIDADVTLNSGHFVSIRLILLIVSPRSAECFVGSGVLNRVAVL